MGWIPAVNPVVVNTATPLPFTFTAAICAEPSLKVTVPVGVTPLPVTVAVKTILAPNSEGLALDMSVVVVDADCTVCNSGTEVLAASSVSPLYTAVMESAPTGSDESVNEAVPELFSVVVPSVVEPFLKVTVPAGFP